MNIIPCTNSPGFKHLVAVEIVNMEGPRDCGCYLLKILEIWSSSIEEIINKEKGESIINVHPDIGIPLGSSSSLKLVVWKNLREFSGILRLFQTWDNLLSEIVQCFPKLPLIFWGDYLPPLYSCYLKVGRMKLLDWSFSISSTSRFS